VKTPWLTNYLKRESKLQAVAKADPSRCAIGLHCLTQCGLRDGLKKAGQFCIDSQLVAALKGDLNKGLFFRGSESLPFSSAIRSVQELIDYLLTGVKPDFGGAAA
jgi:nitronate monooxygenase